MKDPIQEILKQEQELQKHIQQLKLDIEENIKEEYSKDGSDHCRIVSFSEITSSRNMILDPCYYLGGPQLLAIQRKLANANSIASLCENLQEIIDSRKVKVNKDATMINERTIQAIKHSEIGRYLIDHQ